MTPKQKVLKRYPEAYASPVFRNSWWAWIVRKGELEISDEAVSAREAWASAAKLLRRASKGADG